MPGTDGAPDGVDLPASAATAWQAYLGMCAAKAAHFDWLRSLTEKYRHGGHHSLAERAHLSGLLDAHDQAVKHFVACLGALKQHDADGHAALIVAMTRAAAEPEPAGDGCRDPAH